MIEIQNLTTLDIDQGFVQRVIKEVLVSEGVNDKIVIEVAFVGSERIKKLNKKYRHKNKATDVLSFEERNHFVIPESKGKYLGEIVVCPAVVKSNAERNNTLFLRELAHVIIHGTLHLMGYEHENSEEKTIELHHREEKIMNGLVYD
jgi:probable rRNA maturation factor